MPVRTSSDLNSKAKSIRTCLSAYHQRSARTDPTLHQRHQSESALTLRCLTRHADLPANCRLFKREQMLITYIQLITSLSMVWTFPGQSRPWVASVSVAPQVPPWTWDPVVTYPLVLHCRTWWGDQCTGPWSSWSAGPTPRWGVPNAAL